jgi:hypothetical protein
MKRLGRLARNGSITAEALEDFLTFKAHPLQCMYTRISTSSSGSTGAACFFTSYNGTQSYQDVVTLMESI